MLFLLADAVMFLSAISVFNYGHLHYNEAHKKFLRSYKKSGRLSPPPTGCQGYFPHTIATASLVLFVALRGPIVYDCVTVYRNFNHNVALASIVFDVSYMLIWISLWFCFTIKQEWSFKILAFRLPSGMSVSDIYTIQNDHTRESTNSLNGPLPNGHVNTGNEAPDKTKKKKSRATLDQSIDSNAPYPGFETGLGSPSSALRKSGERKQNRVTFEDSRDENDEPSALLGTFAEEVTNARDNSSASGRGGTPRGTPVNMRRQLKRELAAKIHGNDVSHDHEVSSSPAQEPVSSERSTKRKVNRNIFGDFELSETPENTLKRNYRNSLRSKCGQYYRNSREFASPPAAQSSPVLPPKHFAAKDTGRSSSPTKGEIQRREVPPERPPRNTSPGRPHPKRGRYPSPERTANSSVGSLPDSSHSSTNHSSVLFSQNSRGHPPLPQRYTDLQQNSSGEHRSPDVPVYLPPRAPQNPVVPHKHTRQQSGSGRGASQPSRSKKSGPNRELQIMNPKPDMGRRDSALPSSNETSSNDSQDVLCSQV